MKWWLLRVHRDVCRQNDLLHKEVRRLTAERDDTRTVNARLRERIRVLEFDNEALFSLIRPEDRRAAYGFVTTFREIANSEEIERKP